MKPRSLLSLVVLVLAAIAAALLPSTAEAHRGHHHGPAAITPWSFAVSEDLSETLRASDPVAVIESQPATPAIAVLSDPGDPSGNAAGACIAPCCCPAGGAGCSMAPAMFVPSTNAFDSPGRVSFPMLSMAAPPEALSGRRPKPPRA